MRYVIRLAVLLCSVLAGFQVVPASAEKRVALVIGNGNYSRIAGLPNVSNDAAAVADLLRVAKFDSVDVKADLGVAELRRAVREFAGRTADADVAVLFYAGHGIEVDRTNYLIPVDARLASDFDVEDETVSLDRLLQAMEPAKRLRLVILDACRENPFLKSMKRSGATRSVGRGLSRVEPRGSNTLVAFAAKEGALADDGTGPNSPFTAALVKHLATPGLDLRLAFGRVRDEVLKSTGNRQEPHLYGSAGGDTVSIVGAVPAVVPPVVQPPATSEAAETARICREVEGMSSLAMLQVLERQYKGKAAGECVTVRIEEVKKLAMAIPAPAPALKSEPAPMGVTPPALATGFPKLNPANEARFSLLQDTEVVGRTRTYSGETTDLDGCARRCLAEGSCQAFSFNPHFRFCYLIDRVVSRNRDLSFVSGIVRSLSGKSDDGDDKGLQAQQVAAASHPPSTTKRELSSFLYDTEAIGRIRTYAGEKVLLDGCARRCLAERSCQAFSFNRSSGFCYLIDQVTSYERSPGFTSAAVQERR